MATSKNTKFNHRKFYSQPKNRQILPKFSITNGMIINFKYVTGGDKRPLVFVMDTDEYISPSSKKDFSGINLNYMPIAEINKFFIKVLTKARWEYSRVTKMPKVDIWDEENPGIRPNVIYSQIVKKQILNKRDCWRTYKYQKCSMIEQINFNFTSPPLNLLQEGSPVEKITERTMNSILKDSRFGKVKGSSNKNTKTIPSIDELSSGEIGDSQGEN